MAEAVDTVIAAPCSFWGERITTMPRCAAPLAWSAPAALPPDAVAFVETSDEAARILALCNNAHVPAAGLGRRHAASRAT